jgi:trk system potassium uptake protein TrkA
MKSVLIIGMGKFGHHLCENMAKLGNELMIVDEQEEAVEDLASVATSVRIGDCTNEEVLRSLGVGNFDLCIVCIGSNFQSSLEITSLLKDLGAKYVISKANRDIHAKFLLRNGADEVIYPNRDIAKRLAMRLSANHVFDYIQLTEEYAIYEIPVMRAWIGESIRSINFRAKYKVNILGIKNTDETNFMPDADYRFEGQEHLMVLGLKEDVNRILKAL